MMIHDCDSTKKQLHFLANPTDASKVTHSQMQNPLVLQSKSAVQSGFVAWDCPSHYVVRFSLQQEALSLTRVNFLSTPLEIYEGKLVNFCWTSGWKCALTSFRRNVLNVDQIWTSWKNFCFCCYHFYIFWKQMVLSYQYHGFQILLRDHKNKNRSKFNHAGINIINDSVKIY